MGEVFFIRPLLAVLVSLFLVPILILCRNRPNLREFCTFAAAGIKFLIIASMLPEVLKGLEIVSSVLEIMPGVHLKFRVDSFGLLFALVSSFLWIITSLYSVGYMRGLNEHSQTRYFCFFAIALSATIGVAFSANLFTLYLFYEILSFATYPLVTHHQDKEARSSGRKYLLYIVGSSIGLVLPAMLLTYNLSGTLEFTSQGFLTGEGSKILLTALLVMFIFGFAKAATIPLHSWLPAAMVAPTPVSALLHAVAVVKVGIFCIIRVLTGVFGIDLLGSLQLEPVIIFVASVTILVGSLIALSQDNLKRLLAFSTISQLSYMVLGVGLLSYRGMIGGLIHIAMHAFGKITLFFCAGAIFVATGEKNISRMTGIGRRMPVTMSAFSIGAFSIIGLPPCGGFLSKWYLVWGSLEANRLPILIVLLVSSMLNAAYFMPIVYKAFFCPSSDSVFEDTFQEAPLLCIVPPVITAAISVFLLFYPQPFFRLAELMVQGITGT